MTRGHGLGFVAALSVAAVALIAAQRPAALAQTAPGLHLITLKDVADFCEVLGGNPQPYTVVVGKSVRVAIDVRCGEVEPPL